MCRVRTTVANISQRQLANSEEVMTAADAELTLLLTALKQTWAAVRWNVSAHVSLLSNDTHELALNFN